MKIYIIPINNNIDANFYFPSTYLFIHFNYTYISISGSSINVYCVQIKNNHLTFLIVSFT